MTSRPGRRRAAIAVAVAMLGAIGWLVAAPRQLGGSATYVVTRGRSMEPAYRTGDLAVVRPSDRYAVGDVVAYRSRTVGSVVLHRIVGTDGDRFVVKGDNNGWLDPETVDAGAFVGRVAVRVPRGGLVMGAVRGPRGALLLCFALLATTGAARNRRRNQEDLVISNHRLAGAAAATAVLAGAAGLMYARPETVPGSRDTGLRHETSLDYEAAVKAGPVYQDGRVSTGDPVFRSVVPELGIRVGYRLAGHPADLTGTVTTTATVKDDSGWSHTVPLGAPVTFSGTSASAASSLRFRDIDALVADVARRTGVPAGPYVVAVGARITTTGTAAGEPFASTVDAPGVELIVDAGTARPTASAVRPATAVTPVSAPGEVPATILLSGRRVTVGAVRTAATGAAGLAAAVTAGLGVAALRRRRRPEPEQLAARYAGRIVDVRVIHVPADRNVVELESVDALVALADRFEQPVLHEVRNGNHTYVVERDRSLYRYRGTTVPSQRIDAADAAHASAR